MMKNQVRNIFTTFIVKSNIQNAFQFQSGYGLLDFHILHKLLRCTHLKAIYIFLEVNNEHHSRLHRYINQYQKTQDGLDLVQAGHLIIQPTLTTIHHPLTPNKNPPTQVVVVSLDNRYMDATSQINAKKICHWSKVCHVTSLTLDFIGSTQIKTVHD